MAQHIFPKSLENGRPPAYAVLEIPELLEMIAWYLPICDIRNLMRINRHTKAIVDESKRCQKALFLEPDHNSYFQSVFEAVRYPDSGPMPGFRSSYVLLPGPLFTIGPKTYPYPRHVEMMLSFRGTDEFAATLTPITHAMLVCHPSVMTIEVQINCCNNAFKKHDPLEHLTPRDIRQRNTMSLFAPLTIGTLVELTRKIKEDHRSCRPQQPEWPVLKPFVPVVSIIASVPVRADDPLVLGPSGLRGQNGILPKFGETGDFDLNAYFAGTACLKRCA